MAPGFRYATSTNNAPAPGQPQRFIRMMDVQRHPVMYPLSYTPSSMISGGAGRFSRNNDKSRGLRHFSSRVCEKVKEKVQTNYNEVADELVTEYFDSLPYAPQNQEKQQYDAKNIRRRVYDALNVLMAMNIIEKEKKEIRWVGLPTSSVAEKRRLEEERAQRQERIRQKSDQLREYIIQLVAYKSLVQRNRELERRKGCPPDQAVLFLPFIIVNTERKTIVECAISQDKTEYAMSFERPFEIHDDIEVLKRLGLAYGLDAGKVADENIDRVKQCLPPALRVYVDQILDQPMEEEDEINEPNGAPRQCSIKQPEQIAANEEIGVADDDIKPSQHLSDPREINLNQIPGQPAVHSKLAKQQIGVQPQRRYVSVSSTGGGGVSGRSQFTISPGGQEHQYGSNVAVTRPIKRTFIQQPAQGRLISTTNRYVQPSQSAVYQNAQQQQRSAQMRQQLYLVQNNGSAPQPIHHAGPSRFQQPHLIRRVIPPQQGQVVEYERAVEDEDFPDLYGDNFQ